MNWVGEVLALVSGGGGGGGVSSRDACRRAVPPPPPKPPKAQGEAVPADFFASIDADGIAAIACVESLRRRAETCVENRV